MSAIPTAITIIGGVITLIVGGFTAYEKMKSAQIKRAKQSSIPIKIRKSVSYSQFYESMKKAEEILDEARFVPTVILGIHY